MLVGLRLIKSTDMKSQFDKNAGIALILFTVLMVFTMVLHPVGGNFDHLLRVSSLIVITHAMALLGLPFACVGFWGLTRKIGSENFLSISAFAVIVFGLFGVMIAATANGLVLPIFIEKYKDSSPAIIESIQPLLRYNFSVNNAFDYVYTVAFCLAMLGWSIAIVKTKKLPVWVGYFGIILAVTAASIFSLTLNAGSLQGFRLFVITIVLWIAAVGIVLIKGSGNTVKER